jgi:hypothetical protein
MSLIGKFTRRAALVAAIAVLPASPLLAQEISQSQLAAALDLVHATIATQTFDDQLPKVASEVAARLIKQRPDLNREIADTVQATALKLVPRRKDLDLDIARLYAKVFSEDELVAITTFLKSPAGQKYQVSGPKVFADTFNAVQAWADRVGSELLDKTREALKQQGHEL